MAHLKKAATGHLLKGSDGHLVIGCATTTTTTTSTTSTSTTTVTPQNACNNCYPPLSDSYVVTFAGLANCLEYLNGSHVVTWLVDCSWETTPSGSGCPESRVSLEWVPLVGGWRARTTCAATCQKTWLVEHTPPWPCDPVGTYPEEGCYDAGCAGVEGCDPPYDLQTCEASSGATCVVSETP